MKKIIFAFAGLLAMQSVQAQYYFYNGGWYDADIIYEAGGSINAMNCLTDMGGKAGLGKFGWKDFNIERTHVSAGIYGQMTYRSTLGLRLEGTYGQVSGRDEILQGVTDIAKERFNRNLNFRSEIYEISLLGEVHPLWIINNYLASDKAPPRISPYITGGIGYFSFNPQGQKASGSWVDLQPLSTEGQGFKEYPDRPVYKLKQFNYPVGAGLRYELGPVTMLRLEFIYRILTTDYLDDLSTRYINPQLYHQYFTGTRLANALEMNDRQIVRVTDPNGGGRRGEPTNKDAYFSLNLKLSLVLGRERRY